MEVQESHSEIKFGCCKNDANFKITKLKCISGNPDEACGGLAGQGEFYRGVRPCAVDVVEREKCLAKSYRRHQCYICYPATAVAQLAGRVGAHTQLAPTSGTSPNAASKS